MQAIRRALLGAAFAVLGAGPAWADFNGQDASGAPITFKSDDAGGPKIPVHELSASSAVIGHVVVDTAPTTAVTAASLPLPSGASTSAKQAAPGTAGTPSADVLTVQGATSMTPLKVDPSAVTSPVSLASLPALATGSNVVGGVTQSGAWTVQPGNTANTTAWKVDGSAVTQPVSGTVTANIGTVGTLATAAKQPALGTAGSPSTDVLTTQGCAGCKPLAVVATSNPTSTMTRPANTTAYANLQLVASSTTAGSVVVPFFTGPAAAACSFDVAVMKLSWNNTGTGPATGLDGWSLILRLWSAAPTYVNGDGGAYRVATGGAGLLGVFNCTLTQYDDAASGFCQAAPGFPLSIKLASGTSVFWDLQSTGAITPQSGKIATLTPFLKQDTC